MRGKEATMCKQLVNGAYRAIPLATVLVIAAAAQGQQMPAEYDQVLKTLGKQGDYKSNVLKINIPRNDLKVVVDGVATPTPFGFGGWLAMTKGAHGDVMMGDLVLTQDEVNPVMSALLDHGLEVTAVHNHFFFEEPRIFYMHVMGHGTPAELAKMAKPAVDLIGTVPASHSAASGSASSGVQAGTMDTAKLAQIAGHDGEQTGLQDHRRPRRSADQRDGRDDQRPYGAEYLGRVFWDRPAGRDRRRCGDVGKRSTAGVESSPQSWAQCRRHPPAHDRYTADDLLPALLGKGIRVRLGHGISSRPGSTGKK
jgi:Domain of Unknown Function (DUF1259)